MKIVSYEDEFDARERRRKRRKSFYVITPGSTWIYFVYLLHPTFIFIFIFVILSHFLLRVYLLHLFIRLHLVILVKSFWHLCEK